jgi:hypothetical protein
VGSLDEEEKRAKEESDRALGKDKAFESEAHKKDKTTHLALKEAKKLWDRRREEEVDQKHEVSDLVGVTLVLGSAELKGKKVVSIKNCEDCTLELPESLQGMIKLFVEKCVATKVVLKCKLVTSHVEVSHCERFELSVEGNECHTVQVDLSKSVSLNYGPGLFKPEHKVYSAGCLDLKIAAKSVAGHGDLQGFNDYIAQLAPIVPYTPPPAATTDGTTEMKEGDSAATTATASTTATTTTAATAEGSAAAAAGEGGGEEEEELPSLVVGSVPAENGGQGATEADMGSNAAQASFSDPR